MNASQTKPKASKESLILLIAIVTAIILGFILGGFFPSIGIKLEIFGQIFLNILMLLVVPIVVLSMIVGISRIQNLSQLGTLGSKTLAYYLITTAVAASIGIVLVNLIQPGINQVIATNELPANSEFLPVDIFTALKELIVGNPEKEQQGLIGYNLFLAMEKMDILPLILFSIFFGAALSSLGKKAKKSIELFSVMNDAILKLVHWVMYLAPLGILGLIAARVAHSGGFKAFIPELLSLGLYALTVLIGLALHGFLFLSLLLKLFGKRSIASYLKGVATALLNAFSTASSTATLPLTLQGVHEENKVSEKVSNFVLPLGATINMDGTALYEAVAAIFIAQLYGIELSWIQQLIVILTATLAAIGAAGIPEAGLVTMLIVLRAVNLPIEGIGLLLSIDWLLDRFRTTINVWGDSVGAAIVERWDTEKPSENEEV
ncbi:dicarboxylate/amino acid:cation symporter [Ancylomarina salipaludis]|uniref:Dicarboxylate/amino acid:cation symporter n=1 Tax=Ancylomarina salipaludis TaxID=2501299 RepID=A0A4Q1JMY4_9BACT|nr:dicarboxylate/amino acid:cation symporter [Ancylomarina salipaludis]RXQ95804.1 dicarboxylate/amino acid:cation symporter [Ancylomarina salipaludis]